MVSTLGWWVRRLGLVGLLGAGMLVSAVWFAWVYLPQQRNELARTESDVRRLRHGLIAQLNSAEAVQADRPAAAPALPEQAWQALWSALPSQPQRMALQAQVLRAAQQSGLQIAAVQFEGQRERWARQGDEVLWRQRMVLPVHGTHPALMSWLQLLLREPALSIEVLGIRRDAVDQAQLQAQVSLSLWWRQPEGEVQP